MFHLKIMKISFVEVARENNVKETKKSLIFSKNIHNES